MQNKEEFINIEEAIELLQRELARAEAALSEVYLAGNIDLMMAYTHRILLIGNSMNTILEILKDSVSKETEEPEEEEDVEYEEREENPEDIAEIWEMEMNGEPETEEDQDLLPIPDFVKEEEAKKKHKKHKHNKHKKNKKSKKHKKSKKK